LKQRIRANALIIPDIILINISFLAAYLLRFDGSWAGIDSYFKEDMLHLAIVATIIKMICFLAFRLYESLWKYAGVYELTKVGLAAGAGNIIMLGYVFLTRASVPRSIFIITLMIDIILIGGIRLSYRVFRRVIKGEVIKLKDQKRILIIGGGDAGAIIIKEMLAHNELKSKPVAIIDDDIQKAGREINGVPILGGRELISKVVTKKNIDEIILAIPSAVRKDINEIFNICSETDCKVKILPSVSQLIDESVVMQKVRDVDIEDLLGREPVKLDIEEISTYLKGQTILVTGAGGSIGSELCRQLASFDPAELVLLDNYENNLFDVQNELIYAYPDLKLVSVIANIREKPRLESIFAQYMPDVVFHAAAHKHVPLMEANPTEAIKNNVFGTLNVAECADKYKAKQFVLISTDKAVNPTNIMGATKRIAELIIQAMGKHSKTEFAAVRFGNVLGSNGSVIPFFKKQIEQGGPVTVTHPDVIRYFMTIPEAAQLVIQAGAMAKNGDIFVLDMGQPVRIYDLARKLIKLSGFEPDEDIKIEITGLRPGEKLYEELLMAEEGLKATRNDKIFIAHPISTDLGLLKRELDILKEITISSNDDISEYIKSIVPTYNKAENGG
jgi:FlaA1/EpsC-like NDP-sugar epimerase